MGHVFVVNGNIMRVACDAWLLPTDRDQRVRPHFSIAIEPFDPTLLEPWRGRRVVRLRSPGDAPEIFLGDVGRDWWREQQEAELLTAEIAEWLGAIVLEFANAARSIVPRGAKLRLAIPVLGTGAGGLASDKGAVYKALLPALYEAADQHDADMVLVCFDRRSYAAAQRSRARLSADQASTSWTFLHDQERKHRVAQELARRNRLDELVLFLGAGISAGAGLPAWQELLDDLAAELEFDEHLRDKLRSHDPRDQAALLAMRFASADKDFGEAIGRRLTRRLHSLAHGLLASLRAMESVTTNFDVLYEEAVRASGGAVRVLPYDEPATGAQWLLKLHGCIERDTRDLVFTRHDYDAAQLNRGALFGIVKALLLTRHMLFVGYSLSDEDFHALVFDVRRAAGERGALGTVLTLFEDGLFEQLWPELQVVAMLPADQSRQVAARELEIFLDLLGFESADLDSFLLDGSYDAMLDADERALVAVLELLRDSAKKRSSANGSGWARVHALLDAFGANAGGQPGSPA